MKRYWLSHWKRVLTTGKPRFIFLPLYSLAIDVELAMQRLLDACARPLHQTRVADDLTVMVKTFERPATLRRLLRSIRRCYPTVPIVVVDDSRAPTPVSITGVITIVLPVNSGVSAGRNAGLRAVATRYTLVVDDDFVFTRHTDLGSALSWMHDHPEVDVMGGRVVNLPFFHVTNYRSSALFSTAVPPRLPMNSSIDGMPVYEKTANFYIARTERLRLVGWDERLKRVDHTDFFTRARGILLTVYNAQLCCLHAQVFMNARYRAARNDTAADMRYLRAKYFS
jgi:glycosyltransferase involved in cell wall biosynthesis